jgi:hypothetical protein
MGSVLASWCPALPNISIPTPKPMSKERIVVALPFPLALFWACCSPNAAYEFGMALDFVGNSAGWVGVPRT